MADTLPADIMNSIGETRMTNTDLYDKAFMRALGVTKEMLNASFTFRDTAEWDSVAHLNLITNLEDTFDIMLESEDILHFGSYENGKKIMKKYGVDVE